MIPTGFPFTNHWNEGLRPPLPGVAVNVTGLPGQKGLDEAEMETVTGRYALMVIVMGCEVAGLLAGQGIFEVTVQVTTSPFAGA